MSERLLSRSVDGNLVSFIRDGKPLAALRPATLQDGATVGSCHAVAKAVFIGALAARRLIRALHRVLVNLCFRSNIEYS
jgi:hypothetical protein